MKKFVGIVLSFVLMISLCACSTSELEYTDSNNSSDSESLSEISSEGATKIEFEVPTDIVGLVDVNEKFFESQKTFYLSESVTYTITANAADAKSGEFKRGFKIKEWTDTGKGIYLITTNQAAADEKEWFFIHNDYLILSNSILLVDETIDGNAKTGFYGGKSHRFNKNGGYAYHPGGNDGIITTTGSYTMLTDNIMKITKVTTNNDTVIEYYFISNNGEMYVALPQDSQAYS